MLDDFVNRDAGFILREFARGRENTAECGTF
jgi:hypothetical protein